jgi:hypothetical protein
MSITLPPASPWAARVGHEHNAGNLTAAFYRVMIALRSFRGRGGIFPSHAEIAKRAKCDVRTVERALKHGQTLGLVSWIERRVRVGWRSLRTTNLYRLLLPAGPVKADCRPAWWAPSLPDKAAGGSSKVEKQEAREGKKAALVAFLNEAAHQPDLLAARRAALAAQWAVGKKAA